MKHIAASVQNIKYLLKTEVSNQINFHVDLKTFNKNLENSKSAVIFSGVKLREVGINQYRNDVSNFNDVLAIFLIGVVKKVWDH